MPHAFTRMLFHMNPDGTEQMEYYGSNSYWPNAMFYARPIPGHPTKVVAIVGGHHESPRMGELVVFDPARGRREADGVGAADSRLRQARSSRSCAICPSTDSWPKFLHPYPLSDKYFLVSCKPAEQALWGIYLVDVFDNVVLLHEDARVRAVRADPAARDAAAAGRAGQGRTAPQGRRRADCRHLPRRGTAGRAARHGQVAARVQLPFRLPGHGRRTVRRGPGRAVGREAHAGHRAGRGRRLGQLPRAGQHADFRAAAGRRRQGGAADAELVHGHARRGRLVRRLPRAAEHGAAGATSRWRRPGRRPRSSRGTGRRGDSRSAAKCSRCSTSTASAATTASRRPTDARLFSLADGALAPVRDNPNRHNQSARFTAVVLRVATRSSRTPGMESDMHLLRPWEFHADTTRLVQTAPERTLRRAAGRRGLGPADHLDRPERPVPRHLERHPRRRDRRTGPAASRATCQMRKLYAGIDEPPELVRRGLARWRGVSRPRRGAGLPTPHLARPIGLQNPGDLRSAVSARSARPVPQRSGCASRFR